MTNVVPSAMIASDASAKRINLLGMPRHKLEAWLVGLGERPFRAQQLLKWIHHFGVADFQEMTNLSKPLRAALGARAEIRAPELVDHHRSEDGTHKWLVRVDGGSGTVQVLH